MRYSLDWHMADIGGTKLNYVIFHIAIFSNENAQETSAKKITVGGTYYTEEFHKLYKQTSNMW